MKEIFEAFNSRLKSPVFGYFILAFFAYNWKVIFYLLVSGSEVTDRFKYFDNNTSTNSLLTYPLIVGIIGALLYPWINLFFIWMIRRPIERRQVINLISKNNILIREKEFEESRAKLLATKERELINRAKRDEEIKSLPDEKLRDELQKQIEELREQVDVMDKDAKNGSINLSKKPSLVEIYLELARLSQSNGNMKQAELYLQSAAEIAKQYGH